MGLTLEEDHIVLMILEEMHNEPLSAVCRIVTLTRFKQFVVKLGITNGNRRSFFPSS